jgi:superfamily II DNA/RNA helicase
MSAFTEGTLANDNKVPLIGLTATPERRLDFETEKLHRMYGDKRIYPSEKFQPDSDTGNHFDEQWKDLGFMREKLIELKYLAQPTFHPIEPGKKIHKLKEGETTDMEGGGEQWIERIATDTERNKNIKDKILEWAKKGKKILYFGTNVSQSNSMASILEKEGIRSVCITGDTRYATRKLFVDIFNEQESNEIQVMCNYNVLSTGFDSPQIDTVIIARPTTSVVSYQQMVGRGLRGELFGGKSGNRCDIVTVQDNITKFNDVRIDLGYSQYEEELKRGPTIPDIGETFTEDELYEMFRVQKYGGIRFTHKHNYVILIDSEHSNYKDRVKEKSIIYIGTGEKDQGFDKGVGKFNAKVKDPNSILLYFQKPEPNKIIFKYLVKYDSHSYSTEKNNDKKDRRVIKFKLRITKK